jgi:general secretion pathway protein G
MLYKDKVKTGFTIVEILVVIMLIGFLATIMVPRYLDHAKVAKWNMAKTMVATLETDLGMFMMHCDRYPTQSEGLEALQKAPSSLTDRWRGPYGKEADMIDPWGRKFIYVCPGQDHPNSFDIISYGRDGQKGGTDEVDIDISNK